MVEDSNRYQPRIHNLHWHVGVAEPKTLPPQHHHRRGPFLYYEKRIPVTFALLTTQQVPLSVTAEDAAGKVLTDPGTRTWLTSDATILTVSAPDATGAVTVVATGTPGLATISVTDQEPALPDGTAGASFAGSLDFIVSAPADPITQITIVPGTPTDRPTS